jgi:predicted CoA-binding protein
MPKPNVAIIGASTHRAKFGNKAVRAYASQGYDVFPIHPQAPAIEGHSAYVRLADVPVRRFDRVSLYLPPETTLQILDDLTQKPIGEVWLNPGAESDELISHLQKMGLNVVLGCSIVDIGVDPHSLA